MIMSTVIRSRWVPQLLGPSRKDNRGCEYDAYVPDPLLSRTFALEGDVAADVADAENAITKLNAEATSLVDLESLARILLRAESVASSRIEGLEIGTRRLLRAEAAQRLGDDPSDVTAVEVLANIDAMAYTLSAIDAGERITTPLLLEIHRRLLAGTRLDSHAGRFREEQNWIGGSAYNPCSASFVPPPHDEVPRLIEDLVSFANDDYLPAVVQAAIAHAQFETIHPFVDGNGRTGRALTHAILRQRGLTPRVSPPVSLTLATWARDYVEGLVATRYTGPVSSPEANSGMNLWVGRFATACTRSVEDASSFEKTVQAIEAGWRQRLGRVRARSATDLLLKALVGAPVITVNSAASLLGRSYVHTNEAAARLVEVGILRQITVGRRNRAFEAPEIIDAFTDLERQLASPEGNTAVSRPSRGVPYRPQQ
jgi:Fic family protein